MLPEAVLRPARYLVACKLCLIALSLHLVNTVAAKTTDATLNAAPRCHHLPRTQRNILPMVVLSPQSRACPCTMVHKEVPMGQLPLMCSSTCHLILVHSLMVVLRLQTCMRACPAVQ